MVLVEEAKAVGIPRPECPRDDQGIRSLAGVAKLADMTVYDDGIRSSCVGGRCPLPMLRGGSFRSCLLGGGGGSSPVGPRDPVGPDGTLEHSVLDHDDPTGQHADPAGQHAFIQGVLEPLEHLVLDVDLDGPESSGTVGAFSSGRCWPG